MKKFAFLLLAFFTLNLGYGQTSAYCETEVFHLGIPAEVPSSILLTITNVDAQSMKVEIESATDDPVDDLIVNNSTGPITGSPAISGLDASVPGKLSRTLTWTGTPPADVTLNVLWSKASFGGNWLLGTSDITVPFAATCATGPTFTVTFNVTDGTDPVAGATVSINSQNLTTDAGGVATIDLADGTYNYTVSASGFADATGTATVSGAAATVDVTLNATNQSAYCEEEVFHLGIPAEVPSSIFLTITNVDAQSMKVEIESATDDPVDDLIVNNSTGPITGSPAISGLDSSVPGKLSRTLTWTGTPPADVTLNVLWSKASFGGNWLLGTSDITVPFAATCATGPTFTVTFNVTDGTDPVAGATVSINSQNLTTDAGGVATIDLADGTYNYTVSASGFADATGTATVSGAATTVDVTLNASNQSAYCEEEVFHLGIPAEVPSSIFLTITNVDAQSMKVEIESATDDPVDDLIVNNSTGPITGSPAISGLDSSVPGKLSRTLTWTGTPPADVTLNVLWSKESFGGNWLLGTSDITVPFAATCATGPTFTVTFNVTDGTDPVAGATVSINSQNLTTDAGGVATIDLADGTYNYTVSASGFADATGTATVSGAATTVDVTLNASNQSAYCEEEVFHLGIPAEVPSSIFLTITNVDAQSMKVEIESATDDPVDDLIVNNSTGPITGSPAISGLDSSVPGKLSRTLTWTGTPPADVTLNVLWSKESFGGNWLLGTSDITVPFAATCPPPMLDLPDLPITFEDPGIDYNLADFGGNASTIIEDATEPGNMVVQSIRTDMALDFAGTTAGGAGLANPIPFTVDDTKISVRVWSPVAGVPVRLKVENAGMGSISVETEAMVTTADQWETLEFDFTNNVGGTPALDLNQTYNKVTIFFNFGAFGADVGEQTYWWDDVTFTGGGGFDFLDLPITFDDPAVNYTLGDFAGNASSIIVDPEDANNMVVQSIKTGGADTFAGTVAGVDGLTEPIPFSTENTKMSVRVWSPDAGIPVRLKVENRTNGAISVETETLTTTAMAWETLEFDFANEVAGTPVLNLDNTYNKVIIFFNFGTSGADAGEKTYYWDDVQLAEGGGLNPLDLPITFDDPEVTYTLGDFGGNASTIIVDPEDAGNMVVQSIRTGAAEVFAGTTAGADGLTAPIPFTVFDTKMSVRVWSPGAGIPVRLKVEDKNNGAVSVETETLTTTAMAWETLEFDFANEVDGTPALSLVNTYDKVSIFFNFGATGAQAGEQTYYWDDVQFIGGGGLPLLDLPITFDEPDVTYPLFDFAGNITSIVADPEDGSNMVARSIKIDVAELFAGTTAGTNGLTEPIPFTQGNTKMTVRVWSPDAGVPVRLKVEDRDNGAISVETEDTTTVAMAWETLVFDFSNEVTGPALDLGSTYNKITIFFNFGTTGAAAGEKTYYWDDVMMFDPTSTSNLPMAENGINVYPNPAGDRMTIAFGEPFAQPVRLQIFSASGQLVRLEVLKDQQTDIDTKDLESGMYFLFLTGKESNYYQKVMVVRE